MISLDDLIVRGILMEFLRRGTHVIVNSLWPTTSMPKSFLEMRCRIPMTRRLDNPGSVIVRAGDLSGQMDNFRFARVYRPM